MSMTRCPRAESSTCSRLGQLVREGHQLATFYLSSSFHGRRASYTRMLLKRAFAKAGKKNNLKNSVRNAPRPTVLLRPRCDCRCRRNHTSDTLNRKQDTLSAWSGSRSARQARRTRIHAGNPMPRCQIIEFADFECPAAAQFAAVTEPDVRSRIIGLVSRTSPFTTSAYAAQEQPRGT